MQARRLLHLKAPIQKCVGLKLVLGAQARLEHG
jgi:hypothetical protein